MKAIYLDANVFLYIYWFIQPQLKCNITYKISTIFVDFHKIKPN